jgi:hypothetical protein
MQTMILGNAIEFFITITTKTKIIGVFIIYYFTKHYLN